MLANYLSAYKTSECGSGTNQDSIFLCAFTPVRWGLLGFAETNYEEEEENNSKRAHGRSEQPSDEGLTHKSSE